MQHRRNLDAINEPVRESLSMDRQRDPDALPDSTDPSGPCPRCGRVSSFELIGSLPVTGRNDGHYAMGRDGTYERLWTERATVMECGGCADRIVVIEEELVGGRRGGSSGTVTYRGFNWWPVPGAVVRGAEDIPVELRQAYEEAWRCVGANAPHGAVAMFRNCLTQLVLDKGSEDAKNLKGSLKDRLGQMVREGTIPGDLGEWLDHVRLYGNAGAHPDLFGEVTIGEAKDIANLVQTLLEVLYVIPATIKRRQGERFEAQQIPRAPSE